MKIDFFGIMNMQLQLATWIEVEDYLKNSSGIIIPVGSTEQHGPTGFIGTDALCPELIAFEIGTRLGVMIAPTLSIGMAQHHLGFPGSITLRPSTMISVVCDVINSLTRHGFDRFFFLNGHGGNIIASQVSAQDITLELGVPVIAATYWLEAASQFRDILEVQDSVLHACEAETSMMMALEPDLVDDSDLAGAKGADGLKFLQAGEASFRWRSLTHATSNGVIGDPTTATIKKGERLLEAAGDAIAALIADPDTFREQNDIRPNAVAGVPFRNV